MFQHKNSLHYASQENYITKKNVKEHSVPQAKFLLSNHRVVLSWCTTALAFIELKVDNVINKASMFHFQCIILFTACCDKNAEAAENSHICQLLNVFQLFVTHSKFAHAAQQAVAIKAGVC
jgi:uncharacterized membrane protein YidH (DUF202 family)